MAAQWDNFHAFGDDGILQIKTTNSSIDGIRVIDGDEKKVPYITRTDTNNGIARFVSDKNYEVGSDEAGSITVGLDTQTAFFQPHKYVTGQNIQIVTGDHLDEDAAHFLTTVLRNQMRAKFNWGGNGATLGRMKKLELMLPTKDNGEPDWEYMSEYVRAIKKQKNDHYRSYVEKQLSELEYEPLCPLSEVEWAPIAISTLFSKLVPGKGKGLNHLKKTTTGGVDYIGATNRNNGVLCYVEKDDVSEKMVQEGNCIGFIKNGNGSAGYAIYKEEEFISTSDVLYGYADWLNRYTGLFFVAAQDMIKDKYSHGYKRNKQHLLADKVMLPVKEDGKPDFEYMEQFAKNIILRKYEQYLAFIDNKS